MIVPLLDAILGRYICQDSHHPGKKCALSWKYMDEIELITCSRCHPGFLSTLGQTSSQIRTWTEIITILEIYVQEVDRKDSVGVRMCKVEGLWSFIGKCFISDLVGGFTHRLSLVMWKMEPLETAPTPRSICCSERKALISLLCCLPIPTHRSP